MCCKTRPFRYSQFFFFLAFQDKDGIRSNRSGLRIHQGQKRYQGQNATNYTTRRIFPLFVLPPLFFFSPAPFIGVPAESVDSRATQTSSPSVPFAEVLPTPLLASPSFPVPTTPFLGYFRCYPWTVHFVFNMAESLSPAEDNFLLHDQSNFFSLTRFPLPVGSWRTRFVMVRPGLGALYGFTPPPFFSIPSFPIIKVLGSLLLRTVNVAPV